MVIKGKVAHTLSYKLARLNFLRQLIAQYQQEEAALVDEIDALLSTAGDPASFRTIRVTEVELDGIEQSDPAPDRGDPGAQAQG